MKPPSVFLLVLPAVSLPTYPTQHWRLIASGGERMVEISSFYTNLQIQGRIICWNFHAMLWLKFILENHEFKCQQIFIEQLLCSSVGAIDKIP